MTFLYITGAFLFIAAISTAIYMPVLKLYGVSENLFERSAKTGFYSSGVLVASSVIISLLATSQVSKLSSLPGVIICTYFTGKMLKNNLNIKSLSAYSTAFGVLLACMFVVFGIFVIFGTKQ